MGHVSLARRIAPVLGPVVALTGACAPIAPPPSPPAVIERTWSLGQIGLPPALLDEPHNPAYTPVRYIGGLRREPIRPGLRFPAVVHAHGCAGIRQEERVTTDLLIAHGYVVVSPDHFGRMDAERICAGESGPGGAAQRLDVPGAYVAWRPEELRHAVDRTKELPFVDPDRVFVMGFSMGGATVARWHWPDVAGAVITGFSCASFWYGSGMAVPPSVPTLFIADSADPWAPARGHQRCSEYTGMRRNSTDVVMRNNDHAVMGYPQAQQALLRFLDGVSRAR